MENEKNDRAMHRKARKKVCHFCVDRVEAIDYKDVARLRKFISERAKILPRRVTGTCAAHQRELTTAISQGLTIQQLASVIRPHPTFNEGVTEAVEAAEGRSIHTAPKTAR